ncbi:MAG: muconolactone Delta-isomerase family protein [Bacteroidia bacterium]
MDEINLYHQYLVDIELPETLTPEFMSLIPEQRAQVNELMNEGTILSYTLALDRSRLWVIIVARSEEEVDEVLDSMPIMEFSFATIHELMFHETNARELPRISLN